MLKHLSIQNYALIDSLSLPIESGFTVITGETGAGKSIIMGALSLVLGQRSDVKVIRDTSKKCVVEALFSISNYHLESLFDEMELDYDNDCVVRRELLANGKSRAFVNDTPVTLVQLKTITSRLIDIHSQHENLLLNESKFQMNLVDLLAHAEVELNNYKSVFSDFQTIQAQLKETIALAENSQNDKDYAQFQYDQLSHLSLVPGEQQELEKQLELLNHMEEIKLELGKALTCLDQDDSGILTLLHEATQAIEKVAHYMPIASELAERAHTSLIDLQDISAELEHHINDTEYNPQQKNLVEERLDAIYHLEQKHRVDSVEALLDLQQKYEQQLQRIDAYDDEIERLKQLLENTHQQLLQAAQLLHNKRLTVLDDMQTQMEQKLAALGMKNARFVVQVTSIDFTPNGADKIIFLFSANKNADMQPIVSIASGGEIARVMLSLKSLIVVQAAMGTIIFDEIDTGVSGEVAQKMGEMMQQMGKNLQVITITHLPQIAAKGKYHFKVFKHDTADRTETNLIPLQMNQRVLEIAEMMSGHNPTPATLKSAKELLMAQN